MTAKMFGPGKLRIAHEQATTILDDKHTIRYVVPTRHRFEIRLHTFKYHNISDKLSNENKKIWKKRVKCRTKKNRWIKLNCNFFDFNYFQSTKSARLERTTTTVLVSSRWSEDEIHNIRTERSLFL